MISSPSAAPETALADACVLYSYHQRNLLVTYGQERLIRLRWTRRIQREWYEALIRNRPDLRPDRLLRTIELMDKAVPDAHVADHERFEPLMTGTDPKDRHVAAAAIACAPATLVTWNTGHFDAAELAQHRVSVRDPDAFLCRIFDRWAAEAFAIACLAYGYLAKRDSHPTWSEYIDALERDRLQEFAGRLRESEPGMDFEPADDHDIP